MHDLTNEGDRAGRLVRLLQQAAALEGGLKGAHLGLHSGLVARAVTGVLGEAFEQASQASLWQFGGIEQLDAPAHDLADVREPGHSDQVSRVSSSAATSARLASSALPSSTAAATLSFVKFCAAMTLAFFFEYPARLAAAAPLKSTRYSSTMFVFKS